MSDHALRVEALWRYPVKSLGGESMQQAYVGLDGLAGDRLVHVRQRGGAVITSRRKPALLGLQGGIDSEGRPTIDGAPWDSPAAAHAVQVAAGFDAHLVRFTAPDRGQRFDVLPLTVLTDGMVQALGYDVRRFRPNVLIAGAAGLVERDWAGRALRIDDALIGVKRARMRCVMTTFDPDTQQRDPSVLRRVVKEFEGRVALDCWVLQPGLVRVGRAAEVIDLPANTVVPEGNGSQRAPAEDS